MKKLLSLLSILTINGTTMPNIVATNNYENEKNNSEIKNEKNEKNKHLEEGHSTSGQTTNTKIYKLKKWKDYANSIEELKKTYKYLSFKDLNIEINGQGTTVTTQRLTINLSDISSDPNELKTIPISEYSYFFIFAEQTANVEITPYFSGDYIYGKFIFKTYSFMAVNNISINFEINNQILCSN